MRKSGLFAIIAAAGALTLGAPMAGASSIVDQSPSLIDNSGSGAPAGSGTGSGLIDGGSAIGQFGLNSVFCLLSTFSGGTTC